MKTNSKIFWSALATFPNLASAGAKEASNSAKLLLSCFLVRDGLYTHRCLSFFHSFILSPVFRIVNETSTKACLAPGIDQLLNTNKLLWKRTVYRGWIKQPSNCSKQSVCTALPQNMSDSPGLLLNLSCLFGPQTGSALKIVEFQSNQNTMLWVL